MKLFVGKGAPSLGWGKADDPGSTGRRHSRRGRVGRFGILDGWMPPLIGLILLADVLSLLSVPPLLQYLMFGYALGMAGSKAVIVRRERLAGEMPPDRVRHIEAAGMVAGISLMLLAAVVQIAIAYL